MRVLPDLQGYLLVNERTIVTETKEKKLPKVDLYQAVIDKVDYKQDVEPPPGKNWNKCDKLTLVFKLLNTKEDNDGEYDFSVFSFHNLTYNIHFERDNAKSLTKAGKMLNSIFGRVPFPLKSRDVDWEALVGCYASVFVMHKAPNSLGKVFPEISAYSPPKDEEHQKLNQDRLTLIYKGQ